MDAFYASGVWFAEMLQIGLPGLEDFWLWVTFLGDPKCVFIIYFPLAYFLDHKVGIKVLWLGIISEWLNLVSKWFLFGERPFWWVSESGFSSKGDVSLRQFPATCETGPGSPSGHCMISGAALWPIVTTLTAWLSQHSRRWIVKAAPCTIYLLLLLAIGLSRIFILAHFPHQVLGGILAGIGLGWLLEPQVPFEKELSFYLLASLSLFLSTMMTYWTLIALGIDLSWSITLAAKWCMNPDWIRIDTRPFASLCRDVATALGLGLALHSSYYAQLKGKRLSWLQRVCCAGLALLVLRLFSNMAQPQNVALWYGLTFVKYTTFPWIVVALLPKAVQAMTSSSTKTS
ncbi:glucose-6-phosphatase 3 isoform X2 [Hemicordylus capensis]|nr:glucose-6-phosphatase 3 isoform X2 [Hemicordylus capensis]XP_053121615.1 glucose-6-phosphatase 3 isoform X2 [Hemicordylus capensis]XP_053121616.1 glucose-6-phosphatase 3 isoform X2 [Hemicordylus capensis]XP_053121617.1 glucose-6-phosphatase 3 isoform X2 [Hemicordylus capensis]XP_053121618.1 glucose-6-phosphatase 3 isoform X2 [Hemicordylus capensis]